MGNYQKTAMVTGASSGIGRGIACVLAKEGYDLAITYGDNAEGAQETRKTIEAMGRRCVVEQASLHLDGVAAPVVNRAVKQLGHLDLLVCNAGLTRHHNVLSITEEEINFLYNLNYRAYIMCAGAAARHMVKDGVKGNIIFISSTRSLRSYPNDPIYGGLKAALNRSCETLALQLAPHGIRVNVVAPGATRVRNVESPRRSTLEERIPLERLGTPEENGHLVAFLASEKAGYITGTVVKVDGGLILAGMPERPDDYVYSRGWGRPDIPEDFIETIQKRIDDPNEQ